jgi:D-alanyl-D-alanine carboxypeptidase
MSRVAGLLVAVFATLSLGLTASRADRRVSVSTISPELCDEMVRHKTLVEGKPVSCRRLALVKFDYFGFDQKTHHDGEIVVLDAVADHAGKIFDTLLDRRYPLQKARLLNLYDGDDDASMADNNTSSFNDRLVAGSNSLSMHAYGLAIDLNPVQNPFIQKVGANPEVSPKSGENYLDRGKSRPGMAEQVVDIFADNGFSIWGGDWHNPIDYQHFQVSRDLAERLTRVSSEEAKAIFDKEVERFRQCRKDGGSRKVCAGRQRT